VNWLERTRVHHPTCTRLASESSKAEPDSETVIVSDTMITVYRSRIGAFRRWLILARIVLGALCRCSMSGMSGRWYLIRRQWCCRPQNAQRIATLACRNMTRLRASVLSWVSNLRPLAAQENCRLARTRITVLRVCRRRVPRKGDT
jgi:hypothetical protein